MELGEKENDGPRRTNTISIPGKRVHHINFLDKKRFGRFGASFQFAIENFSQFKGKKLSGPFYVRDLPWKMIIMQTTINSPQKPSFLAVGFFLECNSESENDSWSVKAHCHLHLIAQKDDCLNICREIDHLFCPKEKKYGFTLYMPWEDVINESNGYIKNDTVIFEAIVTADVPYGVHLNWDSKKNTGYVGLKNRGEKGSLINCALQALYFINQLRKAVYEVTPEGNDNNNKGVALAMQHLFSKLQLYEKPVGTTKLTKSFGWETLDDLFLLEDFQEFFTIFSSRLRRASESMDDVLEDIFSSYRCSKIIYKGKKVEEVEEIFNNIRISIDSEEYIVDCFQNLMEDKIIEKYKKSRAKKGPPYHTAIKRFMYAKFPSVLNFQLYRLNDDSVSDSSDGFNNRFIFPDHIKVDDYCKCEDEEDSWDYTLHSVFVHNDGNSVVFINPKGDGQWFKFDNEVVSRCSKEEAIDHNYGENGGNNPYMLFYIRQSEMENVLSEVTINDIPKALHNSLKWEHTAMNKSLPCPIQQKKRKESL